MQVPSKYSFSSAEGGILFYQYSPVVLDVLLQILQEFN